MSCFKRANWHSGLTYRQTCGNCRTQVIYTDDRLDFRPWYADGFVYCPKCMTPLRHDEAFAINAPSQTAAASFCTGCGRAFREGEKFCPECGTKR